MDLALLVAVLAIVVPVVISVWNRHDRKLQAFIASDTHRAGLIERHECRAAERYYLTLAAMLDWAQRFYGKPTGRRAFDRCVQLAVFYPLLAALIGWVAVNQTAPGGLEIFRDTPELAGRLWRAAAIVAAAAVIACAAPRIIRYGEILRDRIEKKLGTAAQRPGFVLRQGRWAGVLAEWLAAVVAFAAVVVVANAAAGAVVTADAGVAVAAGAALIAVATAGAAFVAAAGGTVVAVVGDTEQVVLIAIFFLLLPYANAFADWLSLAATRAFLAHMHRTRPGHLGLMLHLLLDLIAGAACLALLLASLVGLLDLWAWLSPGTVPLDWRAYWQAARANPAEGIALWLMGFTTMLPTLVHAIWALTVWQTQKSGATIRAVAMMRGLTADPNDAQKIEIAGLLMRGQVGGFARAALFWGVPLALSGWLAYTRIAS